jgi:Flp pilus assembly protein TadD
MTPEEKAALIASKIKEAEASITADQEDKAKTPLAWVLKEDPENAAAHAAMARMYLAKADPKSAEPHAVKAATGNAGDAGAHQQMAEVYVLTERHAEAAASYATAWGLDPDDARLGLGQGKSLLRAKKFAEAEKVLRKVGEDDAEIQYVWSDLGDALREQGKNDEALGMYMKAQNTNASDKTAFAGATMVYEAMGENSKALDQLSRYIQRDCCSTYSKEWAKPKLAELKAKENAGAGGAAMEAAAAKDAADEEEE